MTTFVPHADDGLHHVPVYPEPAILDSVLDHVGNTPMVRLDRLAAEEGLRCNLLAKCEFFNAGGSIKDRIAKRMVEEAEREGKLIKGKSVVIEPTSGNTGIGLALACATKGYRCIICMPEKMSKEKAVTLQILGAEIIRTPTDAQFDDPRSHISVAKRLAEEIDGGIILDQYNNAYNPLAHYDGTAVEIISAIRSSSSSTSHHQQTSPLQGSNSVNGIGGAGEGQRPPTPPLRPSSGKVDVLVAGAGTGGTVSGISKRLKEEYPEIFVIGVDPKGSLLARPESLNELEEGESALYQVEGIGYEFIPKALTHSLVDHWIKTADSSSFVMARRLIRTEGLLCGGSSGAAMHAALEWLKGTQEGREVAMREGANVVVVLADGLRNYIGKDWLTSDEYAHTQTAKVSH